MTIDEQDKIVQEIVDFVQNEADEADLMDIYNHIWPPDDGQE